MISRIFVGLVCLMPMAGWGATRTADARVGVNRVSYAGVRAPTTMVNQTVTTTTDDASNTDGTSNTASATTESRETSAPVVTNDTPDCRTAYRNCMDEFCQLDESEGGRCACSANINLSKSLIQEIQKIQAEADLLYTDGVEREQLGARAKLVFGESDDAKKSSRASGLSFSQWLNAESGSLSSDEDIGENLYYMAADFCASELNACGARAEMEEMLYLRQVVQECKSFDNYLKEQKSYAEANKRTAEAAVRQARLAMLDTTNKYNRGECLLAYRACIADKGGCGANFENCLDADLLNRRAHACDNILDQCIASREYVLQDWEDESKSILADAAKFSDRNQRLTCLAKIQVCLEDGCSTETNSACLTDVNVAAGICPIISECDAIIPGLKSVVNDKLGYLRTKFCQNDVDACLRNKCGENFTAPECLGKKPSEIIKLCPQAMFPSCKNETQFDIIVQAAVLQMDYQMLQGCLNYFGEQLGRVCGTDMSCLPTDDVIVGLSAVPDNTEDVIALRRTVRENSRAAVEEFFVQFEKEKTVAACQDARKPTGRRSLGDTVFNTAKTIAQIGAENRALRELDTKIAELSRTQDLTKAEQNCLTNYQVETPDKESKNYSYIRSVSFEPSLRNCHVCRVQQVCEVGGEKKATSALKAASGGLAAGAATGTMITPGWGTAIGGLVGAVGAGVAGALSGGQQEFCQEIESCEDINM